MTSTLIDSRVSQQYWTADHPSVLHVARETGTSPHTVAIFFGTLPILGGRSDCPKEERYWLFRVRNGRTRQNALVLVPDSAKESVAGEAERVQLRKTAGQLRNAIQQYADHVHVSLTEPQPERVRQKVPRRGWKPPPPFRRHPHRYRCLCVS